MKSILVLCSRNSVRSQLAEAYLKFYSGHKADISSAGIKEMGIHPYTIQVMEEDNLDLSEHYSKSFKVFKNRKFDILVTVCDEAYKNLPRSIKKKDHIHLSIPDPDAFEGTDEEKLNFFRTTRDQIKKEMLFFIGEHIESTSTAVN
jgi:arsenate reductase